MHVGCLIVTGAGRGIGAATAQLAADAGYPVAVNHASDRSRAQAVVDSILAAGGRAIAVRADVADEADVVRLFAEAERALGPLAALVNNAGITGGIARQETVSSAMLARLWAVNISGPRGIIRHRRQHRRRRWPLTPSGR